MLKSAIAVLILLSFGFTAAAQTVKQIEYSCATLPFAHPYYLARPGFKVVCETPTMSGQKASASAGNRLWAEWILVHNLCQKGMEVHGITIACDYVPLTAF